MRPSNTDSVEKDVPYGTLDLMVLTTLAGMGKLHGYGIARRIRAGRRRRARVEPGHDLSRAASPRTEGLDQRRVGHERQ